MSTAVEAVLHRCRLDVVAEEMVDEMNGVFGTAVKNDVIAIPDKVAEANAKWLA
jgi:hypothetical protein